ncbi:hypothetical protein BDB01DRAFT_783578 [Pilobolus umbonatus]|nr:hypothetical protein BDB01DRAFT_783578 [Pilobolus umbonatus]
MNNTSNFCLDSISRRSSLCPPHHESDSVLSPPLTPALSQHHPFDKRQSTELNYSPNPYNRSTYGMDSYHHWMNHSATMHHIQQQQVQHQHHPQVQHPQQQQHHPLPPPTSLSHQQHHHPQPPCQPSQPSPSAATTRNLLVDRTSCSSRKQPTKQNKHVCNYQDCQWSFKRYEHLKRHMLVHTGERPHVCPHPGCGKRFSRSDNFHAHYRTHEKKAFARQKQQQQQMLNTSSSTSTASSSATHHTYMVKEEKESFMHPFYHHGSYPLLPTPSPKQDVTFINHPGYHHDPSHFMTPPRSVLNTNNTMDDHQKKPHACSHPTCERRFRRLEHLKRHMRIHTQEQPFKCNYPGCLKAFSRSDNLTQHRKTHERRGSKYSHHHSVDAMNHSAAMVASGNTVAAGTPQFMHPPEPFSLADFIREGGHHHNATTTTTSTSPSTTTINPNPNPNNNNNNNHHHHNNNSNNNHSHPHGNNATEYPHINTSSPNISTSFKDMKLNQGSSIQQQQQQQHHHHSILGWQHPGDSTTESGGC